MSQNKSGEQAAREVTLTFTLEPGFNKDDVIEGLGLDLKMPKCIKTMRISEIKTQQPEIALNIAG